MNAALRILPAQGDLAATKFTLSASVIPLHDAWMEAGMLPGFMSSPPVIPADEAKAKAISAVDELVRSALAYNTPARLKELMEFSRRLRQFAPYNTMLLHVQKPTLRYAATVREWAKIGRTIIAASRPLVVLKFMGPVDFVFDVEDTEGEPLPLGVQQAIEDPFAASGIVEGDAWKKTLTCCEKMRIHVSECALEPNLAGDVRRGAGGAFILRLNQSHALPARFATLAHELGHLFCGHLGKQPGEFWEDRRKLDWTAREMEAEAVAKLVASRYGLTTASEKYLSSHLKPEAVLPKFSLEHILTAANTVEELAKGKLPSREKAQRQRLRAKARREAAKAAAKAATATKAP